MENQIQIFSSEQFGKINDWEMENKREYMGVVYVLEYGDKVKIGCTKNPYSRISLLKHQAEDYHDVKIGKVGMTPFHTNYTDNEAILHMTFADFRIQNTELFAIPFEDVVSHIENCGIQLLDESEEIKRRIDNSLDGFKDLLMNISTTSSNNYHYYAFTDKSYGDINVLTIQDNVFYRVDDIINYLAITAKTVNNVCNKDISDYIPVQTKMSIGKFATITSHIYISINNIKILSKYSSVDCTGYIDWLSEFIQYNAKLCAVNDDITYEVDSIEYCEEVLNNMRLYENNITELIKTKRDVLLLDKDVQTNYKLLIMQCKVKENNICEEVVVNG